MDGLRRLRLGVGLLFVTECDIILAGLGSAGAELVSLEESWVDRRYVLAATRWRMEFGAAGEIEVASTYLVDMGGEPPAILVYVAHQDLAAVLRERGIVE